MRLLVGPGDLIVWVFQAFFVVPMSYECGAQLVGTILGFSRFNDIIIYKSVKTIAVRRGSSLKFQIRRKQLFLGLKQCYKPQHVLSNIKLIVYPLALN